jgi:hypothetical protein
MQWLYSLDRDPGVSQKEILQRYAQSVDLAYESLLFNLYLMLEITHFAVADRDNRLAKHRPEPDDNQWNAKLYENELIQSLVKNKPLRTYFEKRNFKSKVDQELIQKMYNSFSKLPESKVMCLEKSMRLANANVYSTSTGIFGRITF